MMFGFVGGDEARRYRGLSPADRRAAVLAPRRLLRRGGPAPARVLRHRLAGRAGSRGGPVGVAGPGVAAGARRRAPPPVGRIHWAGTETSNYWNGYMDGAVRSGERAAAEVLDAAVRRTPLLALALLASALAAAPHRQRAAGAVRHAPRGQDPTPGLPSDGVRAPERAHVRGHLRQPGRRHPALARVRVRPGRARCCARGRWRARTCRRPTACRWRPATRGGDSCCSTATRRAR